MPAPQASTASAGPNRRRATSGCRLAAAIAQPAPWPRHQAVLASAPAMTSVTWASVVRCSSSPPSERGSSRRNRRASCSAATTSAGSARPVSIASARPFRKSTRPWARATASGGVSGPRAGIGMGLGWLARCLLMSILADLFGNDAHRRGAALPLHRLEIAGVLAVLADDDVDEGVLGPVEPGQLAGRAAGVHPAALQNLARRGAGGGGQQHAVLHHRTLRHHAADPDQRAAADDAVLEGD